MSRATMERIAEAVGVSKMTVSRSLRGIGRVSPETRRRVREVAQELGYRVPADCVLGQPVHRGSSEHRLKVLIPVMDLDSVGGDFAKLMLEGLQERLELNAGQAEIKVCRTLEEIMDAWRSSHANGIVLREQLPISWVKALQAEGPVVFAISMDCYPDVDCVYANEMRSAICLQRRLRELGHGDVAWFGLYDYKHLRDSLLAGLQDVPEHERVRFSIHGPRYAAWTHVAMASQPHQTTLFTTRDWQTEALANVVSRGCRQLLAEAPEITAIVVPSQPMADALISELGALPDEQRPLIVCYAPAAHFLPDGSPCASVILPMHDIGRSVPDLIERRLANPDAVPLSLMFEASIHIPDTARRLP